MNDTGTPAPIPERVKSSFRAFAGRMSEEQIARLENGSDTVYSAMIKHVASIVRVDPQRVEQGVARVHIRGGDRDRGPDTEVVIARESKDHHGPLSPWIPHECHITFTFCFPFPIDESPYLVIACLEVELPWTCPDVSFP